MTYKESYREMVLAAVTALSEGKNPEDRLRELRDQAINRLVACTDWPESDDEVEIERALERGLDLYETLYNPYDIAAAEVIYEAIANMTSAEAAKAIGCSPQHIGRLIKKGRLDGHKRVGDRWFCTTRSVDAYQKQKLRRLEP